MEKIILEKLKKIEEREQVEIILAVESGSRAWGFASPDSDYDVRFLYVRKAEDYPRLDEMRDVIEWQLDETLDINGWDIKKALKLLQRSNPTLFEWCASPIVYYQNEKFSQLKELLPAYFSQKKSLYHYWHMASTNYRDYLKGDLVKAKKYFYVLRPILAGQWVLDENTNPPMSFSELLAAELPQNLRLAVDELLEIKMAVNELELVPKVVVLNEYIEEQISVMENQAKKLPQESVTDWQQLNAAFLKFIQ
ncbi:nucleotidyltransferase domain-containing protein [Enterococcus sp. HY326]|uniref:nucleotidyltransferase domain-containing protein n=1 Tax=Enterococcus sp. HY326 TaxID=2971265 RepID=UPI00223F46B9|nr:nucleotidyltransferase domain-containing protein [Enterococcus sp. HY326]